MKCSDEENRLTLNVTGKGDEAHLIIEGEEQAIKLVVRRLKMHESYYYTCGLAFSFGINVTETKVAKMVTVSCHIDEAIKFLSLLKLISPDVGDKIMQQIKPSVVGVEHRSVSLIGSLGNTLGIWHRKPVSSGDDVVPLIASTGVNKSIISAT